MIVDCAAYHDGKRLASEPTPGAAVDARKGEGSFAWIGYLDPTPEELGELRRAFQLHELIVEDAAKAHQRPKLETYDDVLLLVLKPVRFVDPDELIETGEVLVIVGPDYVISVRHGLATELSEVRHRAESRPDLLRLGPQAVLHAIIDRVVDGYRAATAEVDQIVREVEAEVLLPNAKNPFERIYRLKREVLEFHGATAPLLDPLEQLQRGRVGPMSGEMAEYMRDVHDHLVQVVADLHRCRELLNNSMDVYLSMASNSLNASMKQLTLVASLFLPLTFLTGFFGMNFGFLVNAISGPGAVAVGIGLMLAAVVLQLMFFKRRGLI